MAKVAYLAGYDDAATDEVIILIARDVAGPYTIIDGTHRPTALYLSHLTTPNTPWKGGGPACVQGQPREREKLRPIVSWRWPEAWPGRRATGDEPHAARSASAVTIG
jgi:hypothetical protein